MGAFMSVTAGCTIRRATPADAEILSNLATRTFFATYSATNNADDVAAYLAKTYSPALQLAEITSHEIITLIVLTDEPIAFAQLLCSSAPYCVSSPSSVELWRFYVDHAWHGQGIAGQLMRAILDEAEAIGKQSVWLGVWEHNPKAIAFYRKWSFVDVGSQTFHLGADVQTDRVMLREAQQSDSSSVAE